MKFAKALKYQRTEYGKQVRKAYESGEIKERRCNMREHTIRNDEVCNTITTVQKDNYIVVSAALRGRYNSDGRIEQRLEIRDDEVSNALTTVQKDNYIIEKEI
jgi:predicted acyl esterase